MGIGFSISSACSAAKHIANELKQKPSTIAMFQKDIERNFNQYCKLRTELYQKEKQWPDTKF